MKDSVYPKRGSRFLKIILPLLAYLICSSEVSGQRDYRTFVEADFLSSNGRANSDEGLFFSIRNMYGVVTSSTFYGIGIGYDRYPDIAILPILFDAKYIFYGKGFKRTSGLINGFFSVDFGYGVRVSKKLDTTRKQGVIFSPGIGVIGGNIRKIKFIFHINYNLQEFGNGQSSGRLALKIGAFFTSK